MGEGAASVGLLCIGDSTEGWSALTEVNRGTVQQFVKYESHGVCLRCVKTVEKNQCLGTISVHWVKIGTI